jgi:alpha-mannosidase
LARRIDAAPFVPHAKPRASVSFYAQALAESPELPVVRGELNTVFEGCYTSHGDIKRMNREGENSLLTAETSAALAALLAGASYPLDKLAQAWRTVCFHQFHDILCGCAIGVTYREAGERMSEVMDVTCNTADEAVRALAGAMDTRGKGESIDATRVVVFNPLAWERTDVVRVPMQQIGGRAPAALQDEAGKRVPVQISGDELIFVAENLPALGARVYRAAEGAAEPAIKADTAVNALDNGLLRLHVNAESGSIDSLTDLETGRELAGPWAGWGPEAKVNSGMLNRMQVCWEQPHSMSAWNIGDLTRVDHLITGAEVHVVEQGPVRAAIEVRRKVLHSEIVQSIVMYRGLRRIDFETRVDWHEKGSAHADAPMLRVTFAPLLDQSRATFEVAFAGIERPADGREVPALRWADLSDANYGVSLLNNCKYGHQAHGNTLGLTLVRASYEPDNNPDEGLHQFTYSLYPHQGTWKQANTERRAAELNQPVQVAVTDAHTGSVKSGQAWLKSSARNVAVSAMKFAEDQPAQGAAVIVRVYEAHGQSGKARLQFGWPVARAEEVDMLERPIGEVSLSKGAAQVTLKPHEIKTLKLYTV